MGTNSRITTTFLKTDLKGVYSWKRRVSYGSGDVTGPNGRIKTLVDMFAGRNTVMKCTLVIWQPVRKYSDIVNKRLLAESFLIYIFFYNLV